MRSFPTDLDEILDSRFLAESDWTRFRESMLSVCQQIGQPNERIMVAERDPVDFVAVLLAGICRGCDIFLANPDWKDFEWGQVSETTGFHRVFGDCPLDLKPDEAAAGLTRIMIPTGGSTGSLRFCVHTLDTLSSAVRSLFAYHNGSPLRSLICLPLFHVSGLMPVIRALLTWGVVRFADWKSLESGAFEQPVDENFSISLVPTQLMRLLEVKGGPKWLKRFACIYLGGGGTRPACIKKIQEHGLPVHFVYGMTETAAMIAAGKSEDIDEEFTLWARPLPGVQIGLTEGDEIEVESASLFHGYYPNDSKVSIYKTGDLGRRDKGGKLTVVGRSDFLINTGGEMVNPAEVEAAIIPFFPQVNPVVLSLPDEQWGERVVAVLEGPFCQEDGQTLKRMLERTLAPHKIPKEFITGVAIPRTTSGKVDYPCLRKELEN